ncbi:MAG TPA: hypothetical protein VMT46_06985 [Anaerolineaceae bacterium]|nr:hypothetical protein [Anaerolineaceae bacterium]
MNNTSRRYDNSMRRVGSGAFLILIGLFFLLEQLGRFTLHNWWALFILLPVFGSFGTAYTLLRRSGKFTAAVWGSLFTGLTILTVALIFLLGLSWSVYWPLFIILPGLSLIFTGGRAGDDRLSTRIYRPWAAWLGIAAALLGTGFLLQNLGVFYPREYLANWWAVPILVVAFGGLATTLSLLFSGEASSWAVIGNLVGTVVVAVVGGVALSGLSWNLLAPVILIALGVLLVLGVLMDRKG